MQTDANPTKFLGKQANNNKIFYRLEEEMWRESETQTGYSRLSSRCKEMSNELADNEMFKPLLASSSQATYLVTQFRCECHSEYR